MAAQDRLSILVPVYNEAGTVTEVLDRLLVIALPIPREILVIDDGSTDGTGGALDRYGERGEMLRIIHAPRNAGKGAAIRRGLDEARGTIIAIQDADLELDPAQLADLIEPILDGQAGVVYGSRFSRGHPPAPWLTIVANRTLTAVTNVLFRSRITDMETCYKIMRAEVARSLALESNRFDIEPEITAKLLLAGHRIVERPIVFQPRKHAEGKKIGWRDGVRALRVLVGYRFSGWRPAPAPGARAR
jgi:glycosyltransferase involved in cell wall biosynthesis